MELFNKKHTTLGEEKNNIHRIIVWHIQTTFFWASHTKRI
jgi:hypothetical protein